MGDKSNTIRHACIIIPTYNEKKNIEKTLDKTFSHAKKQKYKTSVLVVDDNSPDKTNELVKKYQKKNKNVHLLLRKKKDGLGAAYIHGMQHALKTLNPDVIIEMDADGSHNPKDYPRLIQAITQGADFAIGSRYIKGGKIPPQWGWNRKLLSNTANMCTRVILGLKGVKDTSGGFRAITKEQLKKINWKELRVKGYAFQTVLLEQVMHNGGTVQEVPITFTDRTQGESKMRVQDMAEGLLLFSTIRIKRIFGGKQ